MQKIMAESEYILISFYDIVFVVAEVLGGNRYEPE